MRGPYFSLSLDPEDPKGTCRQFGGVQVRNLNTAQIVFRPGRDKAAPGRRKGRK
jgi:hypothetical protein